MEHDLAYFRLREEIEDFLYEEADLLDQRRFGEWLDRLTDDLHYFMPMRRNVAFGTHAEHENTRAGQDISWFDEDKWTLSKRVEQIMTGIHWAEEPLSRVCHFVTNIRGCRRQALGCCGERSGDRQPLYRLSEPGRDRDLSVRRKTQRSAVPQ
jgi:3-phenylpropionate/cinnamic acid dioxygenase small subunit